MPNDWAGGVGKCSEEGFEPLAIPIVDPHPIARRRQVKAAALSTRGQLNDLNSVLCVPVVPKFVNPVNSHGFAVRSEKTRQKVKAVSV
jgi:hypothetical protein